VQTILHQTTCYASCDSHLQVLSIESLVEGNLSNFLTCTQPAEAVYSDKIIIVP